MKKKIKFFSFLEKDIFNKLKEQILFNNLDFIENNDYFEYLIVIGGDGTLLSAMKQYQTFNIKIIPINYGHIGYNLEKNNNFLIDTNIEFEEFKLLEIETNLNKYYAINELLIYTKQNPAKINIKINNLDFYEFIGSGFIISTQIGSTGLNRSIGGPLLIDDNFIFTEYLPVKLASNKYLNQPLILNKNYSLNGEFIFNENNNLILKIDGISNDILEESFKIKLINSNAKIIKLSLVNKINKIRNYLIGKNND